MLEKGETKMRKTTKILVLLLTVTLIPIIPQVPTASPSPGATIYVHPSKVYFDINNATIGTTFNVSVWVTGDFPLNIMMWQVYITFDANLINVTQVWGSVTGTWTYRAWPNDNFKGRNWDPDYIFYGKTGGMIGNPYFYDLGPEGAAIKIGDTLFGEETIEEPKKLCTIEFVIQKLPQEGETLSCVLGINNEDTFIYDMTGPIPDVTKIDGQYQISYPGAPPPPPPPPPGITRLFVHPEEIIDPTMLPSSTFNVNITIENVTEMIFCSFNLSYNSDVLQWIGIKTFKIQDQLPTTTMQIDDPAGFIKVELTYTNPITLSDPTALVEITFHVEALGSSPLDLHDTQILDSEGSPIEHEVGDGFFMSLIRDVTITNVTISRDWAYETWPVNITLTAKNLGMINETFNVKLYYDDNMITELTITDLPPDQEVTIVFTWDTSGVAGGNYTITVEAEILEYELNVTNNVFTDGTIQIRLLGDIDGNCSVDMHDLYLAALAFGSYEGHPDWNPYADLDQNGIIDMRDLFYVASNFGKVCP